MTDQSRLQAALSLAQHGERTRKDVENVMAAFVREQERNMKRMKNDLGLRTEAEIRAALALPPVSQVDTHEIMVGTTKRGGAALTAHPRPTSEVSRVDESEHNGEHQQAEVLTCADCGHRWPAIVTYYQSPMEFPSVNPGRCPECDGAPSDD